MAGSRASNPNSTPAGSPAPGAKKASTPPRQDKEGATSSNYLQQTRADNPEPSKSPDAGGVRLSECRFETPVDKLRLSGEFEMSCKVDATGSEPKNLNVIFRLYCTWLDAKGAKAEEDLKANWSAKLAKKAGSQVVKAKGTLFRPKTLKGPSLEYHLVAEHPGAKEKCASAKVAVAAGIEVQAESLTQENFLPNGVIPLLDIKGRLPEMLASAISAASKPGKGGQNPSMLIQGHADTSDSKGLERSQLRALGIRTILENDGDAFSKLALANGSESEFYKNLEALSALGWGTDPKTGKQEALRDFQSDCEARFGMRIAETIPGSLSWKALHRCIVAEVQERLGEDSTRAPGWKKPQFTPANKGVFGWGAAAPAANGPKGRTVDLLLYNGKNPGIQALPPGLTPSLQYNVLEDAQQVTKKPIAKVATASTSGALPEPLPGEAPWMEEAIKEAKRWKGAKEDVITKEINYHKEIGFNLASMVGSTSAWCASFANYCLKKSGYPIVKTNPQRAISFTTDDGFVEIAEPRYGAIMVQSNSHVCFVAAKYRKGGVIALGGNTSDKIMYAPYPSKLKFYLPKSYQQEAASELIVGDLKALNASIGIGAAVEGTVTTR